MSYKARRKPTHPGAHLRDIMRPIGRTNAEIAELLGLSRQHLNDILKEKKRVTPRVAVRLGKLFGNGADFWVSMQVTYDIWQAVRVIDVTNIPTLKSRVSYICSTRDKT